MQHIDTVLVVGCYLAIIALYVWVFVKIEEIKTMVYNHNESERHVKSDQLVFRDVCEEKERRFEEKITVVREEVQTVKGDLKEVKKDVKEVKNALDAGFEKLVSILTPKKD